jgi:hypothetical protein
LKQAIATTQIAPPDSFGKRGASGDVCRKTPKDIKAGVSPCGEDGDHFPGDLENALDMP